MNSLRTGPPPGSTSCVAQTHMICKDKEIKATIRMALTGRQLTQNQNIQMELCLNFSLQSLLPKLLDS